MHGVALPESESGVVNGRAFKHGKQLLSNSTHSRPQQHNTWQQCSKAP